VGGHVAVSSHVSAAGAQAVASAPIELAAPMNSNHSNRRGQCLALDSRAQAVELRDAI
jgi:hypothetical protein